MKTRIITLCLMIAFFGGINLSYGAFAIKKTAPAATEESATVKPASNDEATVTTKKASTFKMKQMNFVQKIKAKLHPDVVVGDTDGRPGWPGILALVFGILALLAFSYVGFVLFSLGAFIFGIIGLGSGYKYHLLAVIGLVIGIVALLALL